MDIVGVRLDSVDVRLDSVGVRLDIVGVRLDFVGALQDFTYTGVQPCIFMSFTLRAYHVRQTRELSNVDARSK